MSSRTPKLILTDRSWGKLVQVEVWSTYGDSRPILGSLERVCESYWRWWPGQAVPGDGKTFGVWTYREALWRLKRVAVALWGRGIGQ